MWIFLEHCSQKHSLSSHYCNSQWVDELGVSVILCEFTAQCIQSCWTAQFLVMFAYTWHVTRHIACFGEWSDLVFN